MPFRGDRPSNKVTIKSTRKIKNRTLAIEAAPAAIPPKPNTAATMAIIKNITVQRNILFVLFNYKRKIHAAKIKA
jgi:hypothetical protein